MNIPGKSIVPLDRMRVRTLVSLALALAACAEHDLPPLAPGQARVMVSVRAQSAAFGALGATSVRIAAAYRRTDGGTRPLTVTPEVIALESDNFSPAIAIELAPCLTDASAGVAGESGSSPGCFLQLAFMLFGPDGQRLDSVVVRPPNPVTRAGTLDLDTVSVGGATVVTIAPSSVGLVPGDSVQLAVTTRTGTGIQVNRPVTYATRDSAIATVSASGRVTAAGIGTVDIIVTGDGGSGALPVTVRTWNATESAALAANAIAAQNLGTTGFGVQPFSFEGTYLASGLLTDEWTSGDTFSQRDETDRRAISASNELAAALYRHILRTRNLAQHAVVAYTNLLRAPQAADTLHGTLGQMYLVQGLAELMTAETFCAGTAFINVDSLTARRTFGATETSDETFARAEASFARALAHGVAAGAAPLATFVVPAARLGRARAHLGRGRFADALADASAVPAAFVAVSSHAVGAGLQNGIWVMNVSRRGYSVSNAEGGVGLAFRTAADPRLPVAATGIAFDGVTQHFRQFAYSDAATAVPIGSGLEAALIRAEAFVAAGNFAAAAAELNALRANAGLPLLGGAPSINVIMSERAFWLFGTGRRLADLRRLVRHYGANQASVFPTGAYHKGGVYGSDVNFPISDPGQQNPHYRGCLNRDA